MLQRGFRVAGSLLRDLVTIKLAVSTLSCAIDSGMQSPGPVMSQGLRARR